MRTALKTRMQTEKKIEHTRLETWAMPGVPDVLLCDHKGNFHFVELKATGSNAVEIRPHQVAWLTRHKHASTWILVRRAATRDPRTKDQREECFYLYKGDQAMDLKLDGLKVSPVYFAEKKADWDVVFDLICDVSRGT